MEEFVEITEPAIVVKINQTYRDGMSTEELYEIIRGIWRLKKEKMRKARFLFGVYHNEIKEVYEIEKWQDAGTSEYRFRKPDLTLKGRSEIVGKPAQSQIRDKYVGKRIPPTYQTFNYLNI